MAESVVLISWDNPVEKITLGPKLLKEMEHVIVKIRKNSKISHDRQKSYADNKRTPREFKVGDHVYLEVKPKISSLKIGMCNKWLPDILDHLKF